MSDRTAAIRSFLETAGWADAETKPLAGDASNRRYLRLSRKAGQDRAVLMDAPPEKGEDVRPFVHIATWLAQAGFSAPAVLAKDENLGFLLLEDLGDDLFARVVQNDPGQETSLYSAATDVLAQMHSVAPPPDLASYSVPVMTEMAALAFDWYLTHTSGENEVAKAEFCAQISALLSTHAANGDVLIQRDYHSENLLWLPQRNGVSQVGLLDFQDAMLGHRAYDLVSLLQDARRDVSPLTERQMMARYVAATDQDAERFDAAYHVLGAQRNLRILGVFTRLCLRDGKAHYVDLIPRVWGLLQRDLDHPVLGNLSGLLTSSLPEPTPSLLEGLKQKCATV